MDTVNTQPTVNLGAASGAGGGSLPPSPPPAIPAQGDPRWPYQQGPNAPDEIANARLLSLAEGFIAESRRIRWLQQAVLLLATLVLAALLFQLYCVVKVGFEANLGKAESMLVEAAKSSRAASAPSEKPVDPVTDTRHKERDGNAKGAVVALAAPAASTPSDSEASEVKSLHELLSTGIKSITYSTVAVISILVIAVSVIMMAVAKAVFSMAPHRLGEEAKSSSGEATTKSDPMVVFPTAEFAKEVAKQVLDVGKQLIELFKAAPSK